MHYGHFLIQNILTVHTTECLTRFIFSILGVQFFGEKFWKCKDENGDTLSHEDVNNKTDCIAQYGAKAWQNSQINFDNVIMAFFALYQVVRNIILSELKFDIAMSLVLHKRCA